jgi:Cu(I)/Ag(I) efflux system protein CusF
MTSIQSVIVVATVAALVPPVAAQQPSMDRATHHLAAGQKVAQGTTLIDGEVRRVDKEAKKLTIKHGPIDNLDMPAMTMVFQVKDPAMLDQVKAGDKVKFAAEKVGGAFTVTWLEPAK